MMTAIAEDKKKPVPGKTPAEDAPKGKSLTEPAKAKVRGKAEPKAKGHAKGKPKVRVKAKAKLKAKGKAGPDQKKKAALAGPDAKLKKLQKREEMQQDLARELAQVRANITASAQALATRLDAEVASVLCAFDGHGIPGEPERLPTARVQTVMLKAIRSLRVKPEKGRLKDLARMGALADLLSRLML
jgi:hypothetical protein